MCAALPNLCSSVWGNGGFRLDICGVQPFNRASSAIAGRTGWSRALRTLAAVPFEALIPGHGPVMTRADFTAWRRAYDNFVECGHSGADKKSCVDGRERDAAKFIDDEHRKYVRAAADYYLSTRLRSSPEERQRYCKPLKASVSSAAYRAALSA